MRVVLLFVVSIGFSLLITSCENSTGVDNTVVENRLLYFDTSNMIYSKTVKAGDTLKVPVSIKYLGEYDYNLEHSHGEILETYNSKKSAYDTTLLYFSTIDEIGLQEIELITVPSYKDSTISPDTFLVEFEVLPRPVQVGDYDNSILIGDTIKVPIKINYPNITVSTSRGEIIGDSLLVIDTQNEALGALEATLEVVNSSDPDETITLSFYLVNKHSVKKGDRLIFLSIKKRESRSATRYLDIYKDTVIITEILESDSKISLTLSHKRKIEKYELWSDKSNIDSVLHDLTDSTIEIPLLKGESIYSGDFGRHCDYKFLFPEYFIFNVDEIKDEYSSFDKLTIDTINTFNAYSLSFEVYNHYSYEDGSSSSSKTYVPGLGKVLDEFSSRDSYNADHSNKMYLTEYNDKKLFEIEYDVDSIFNKQNFLKD